MPALNDDGLAFPVWPQNIKMKDLRPGTLDYQLQIKELERKIEDQQIEINTLYKVLNSQGRLMYFDMREKPPK